MVYNAKYGRYFTEEGLIYRYLKKTNKLKLVNLKPGTKGYVASYSTKIGFYKIHRAIWETFVGPIPEGYEIDHINGNRSDNRLCNLRCVSHKENMNNIVFKKRISDVLANKSYSVFGDKFKSHYGYGHKGHHKQYIHEYAFYSKHRKCSWEVEYECD